MTALPKPYAWLAKEPGPKMLLEAIAEYGTIEVPGKGSNPKITGWAHECGIGAYSTDSIPWCGLFMSVCAKRAGWGRPTNPLWARNWAEWGEVRKGGGMLGDILVFARGNAGHVAMYIGEDKTAYRILGGNQADQVCIERKPKSMLIATRHAPWRIAEPPNVRKIMLSPAGVPLAINEA